MNFGVLLATFALVIPAELPDKTFISCIVMASRHQPLPVWIGGASALILQAGVAVLAGRLLALLPHTAVRSVIAALFIGGAAYLLFVPEKEEEAKGERLGERGAVGDVGPPVPGEGAEPAMVSGTLWRPMLTTFSIVALAEFGDITQILIANLSARYHATWSVFAGASAAFIVVSGLGVLGGRAIIRVVPLAIVRRVSGLALLGLGIYTIVGLI
ncbi:MAG: TMEM165/GDT1 family protein [Acidimicrobiales bacterium]